MMAGVLSSACWCTIDSATTTTQLELRGDGLSFALLGANESRAQAAIVQRLGSPTRALSTTPDLKNCGVAAMATWHNLSAYFDHDRLVGLSVGPGGTPSVRTSKGLRLGQSIRIARTLYGSALRVSNNQGGAWFVSTSEGRLDGFLVPSNGRPDSASRIFTIDVGDVGCPAMSP
jgi:hypothetical protein